MLSCERGSVAAVVQCGVSVASGTIDSIVLIDRPAASGAPDRRTAAATTKRTSRSEPHLLRLCFLHDAAVCLRAAWLTRCVPDALVVSPMPSATQFLVPALVVSNVVALYAVYAYRRSLLSANEQLSEWLHAKNDRRERKLKEKQDRDKRRDRNTALHQPHQRPAALSTSPTIDDAIEQHSDSDRDETLPFNSNTAPIQPPSPPPIDIKHAFHAHSQPYRKVYNTDALLYLQNTPQLPGCVITSLPDHTETPFTLPQWKRWFIDAVAAVIRRTPVDGLAMFYQTDVRSGGEWVSKSYLVLRGAERAGGRLVWHKIVVQSSVGSVKGSKAAYAHLLCFSPAPLPGKVKSALSGDIEVAAAGEVRPYVETASSLTPDILSSRGAMTWKRAMGLLACAFACEYVQRNTRHRCIVDPFCGQGSVLAVANAQGMDSVGVDTSKRRCCLARQLDVRGKDLAGKGEEERTQEGRKLRRQRRKQTRHAERLAAGAETLSETKEEEEEEDADFAIGGSIFADEAKQAPDT